MIIFAFSWLSYVCFCKSSLSHPTCLFNVLLCFLVLCATQSFNYDEVCKSISRFKNFWCAAVSGCNESSECQQIDESRVYLQILVRFQSVYRQLNFMSIEDILFLTVIPWIRVADWFAQLNNKMGGDLKKINEVGKYMVEVWKALGMDTTKVQFILASEEINKRSGEYWTLVMDVAMKNNLKRVIRCSGIMGRSETDDLSAAQIFYPCMQCADIFFLKVLYLI